MNFDFSIIKNLLDVAHGKLINIKGRPGVLDMFLDISHILEMAICVVNQLKNDSYIFLGDKKRYGTLFLS